MGLRSFTVSSPLAPPLALKPPRLVRSVTRDLFIQILSRMSSCCFYLLYPLVLARTIIQWESSQIKDLLQDDDTTNATNAWSTTGIVGSGGDPSNPGPEAENEETPYVIPVVVEDMPETAVHLLGSLHGILARHAA